MIDFVSFKKIERLDNQPMFITQKLHGTNAQIYIKDGKVMCGSRARWITPGDDNYGFAAFVHENSESFIEFLGDGHHFGEWVGKGINSGEGLSEKIFCLFDFWRYKEDALPPRTRAVPVLYSGRLDLSEADIAMADLKENGSKLVPGFMRPEGIVVTIGTMRYKRVFEEEDTRWTKSDSVKIVTDISAWEHMLQPIRMAKIFSTEEQLKLNFPKSLPDICKAYLADIQQEYGGQYTDDDFKSMRKSLGTSIFSLAKYVYGESINQDK